MNILAIDSSTEACSAALLRVDGATFGEFEIAPRQHNRLLPAMMAQVLQTAAIDRTELTHCAFTNGPGAFTGIRIAAALAQGIGLALQIPLLPVSTLAVLAQACVQQHDCDRVLVALDARMQEIYWAVYQRDSVEGARLVGAERLSPVDGVVIASDLDYGAGHGWMEALRTRVSFEIDVGLLPNAQALLALAAISAQRNQGVEASTAGINYLRNQIAEKTRK